MAQCNSVLDHAVVPKRDILQVLLSAQSLNVPILQFFCIKLLMYLFFFFGDKVYQLRVKPCNNSIAFHSVSLADVLAQFISSEN